MKFTLGQLLTTSAVTCVIGMVAAFAIANALVKSDTVPGRDILIGQPTMAVECEKPLKTYPTKKATRLAKVKKIRRDPTLHLTSAISVPDDGHEHIVAAIYDSKVGEINQLDSRVPLPWFTLKRRTELGIGYGLNHVEVSGTSQNQWGWRAELRHQFIQAKRIEGTLQGNAHADGSWYLGALFSVPIS